jgi:hypothetical protein
MTKIVCNPMRIVGSAGKKNNEKQIKIIGSPIYLPNIKINSFYSIFIQDKSESLMRTSIYSQKFTLWGINDYLLYKTNINFITKNTLCGFLNNSSPNSAW